MSKELIRQRILQEKPKPEEEFRLSKPIDKTSNEPDTEILINILEEDPNIFLLNNLLLTIQFFENYDRDFEILRENWFKEVSLESYHKKCFYADSIFKRSGAKVKFSPPNEANKVLNDFFHPLRIYISSDNVEAAFDPTHLGRVKKSMWPQYQFMVKMDEKDEKLGTASLILFKILKSPQNRTDLTTFVCDNLDFPYKQGKSVDNAKEEKFIKAEKFLTFYNDELNSKMEKKKISLKSFKEILDGQMPPNGFYYFPTPDDSLNPVSIVKYRMNAVPEDDFEIPQMCFQKQVMETTLKTQRIPQEKFSRPRKILNSAAFKGHFCDVLIEKLAKPLGFDVNAVQAGITHEEFAIFYQEMKINITHVIEISDWKNFISLTERRYNGKFAMEVAWPTNQMWEIMNILPCYAVPYGLSDLTRKNLDHEKKWKIVFPKTEQFLLLHMMHSHIRCYFFILLIYKSFIEPEINTASLGPRHLLHLLFWQVHKNFLAWPDERPAEVLLNYLQILYKKLQNKYLRDFFFNQRNLFASSSAKDLHKAQALIKNILQNPIPHVLNAIRNLETASNFYPMFDVLKVNAILNPINNLRNQPKIFKKEKNKKKVCFENAEERLWRKSVKQIQSVLKDAKQETKNELISSIDTAVIVNFDFRDSKKFNQILVILILHYVEMVRTSIEFNFLTQAFMYLFQIQSLFELINKELSNKDELKSLREKIIKLKDRCDKLEQERKLEENELPYAKKLQSDFSDDKMKNKGQMIQSENVRVEKQEKIYEKNLTKTKILKNNKFSDQITDQTEECKTKL